MWQIVINGPGYFDTAYDLPEGITTLGRADENDIVLSGDLVSRRHASLHVQGDGLRIEDLGSRNGSRINGHALTGSQALKNGDTVFVGENSLTVRQPQQAERIVTEAGDAQLGGVQTGVPDVRSSVILARAVRESFVLRALDNVLPFAPSAGPEIPTPFTTDAAPPAPHAPNGGAPTLAQARTSSRPSLPLNPGYEALWLVSRVAQLLATAPSLHAFLEQAVDWLMHDVSATTGVLLLSKVDGTLRPLVVRHRSLLAHGEVPVSRAIVDEALREGEALVVADVQADARFASRQSVLHYGASQVLCVPLGSRAPFLGALYLNRPAGAAPSAEALEPTLDLCTAIGHLIATALAKFAPDEAPEVRLRMALERSLPPELARRRATEQGNLATQMEERAVTVLFADVAGFSALAKRLGSAVVSKLLQEFFQAVSQVVLSFEGTVVTFVGDSALTVFGAPYSKGDDAVRATRAALALRFEWRRLMQRRLEAEQCTLKVGIHTGRVLAGTVGTDRRLDYVVVGEPVNTAAWLVGIAGPDQVLVTDRTLLGLGTRFETKAVGEHTLGSREKLAIFEVVAEDSLVNTNPGLR